MRGLVLPCQGGLGRQNLIPTVTLAPAALLGFCFVYAGAFTSMSAALKCGCPVRILFAGLDRHYLNTGSLCMDLPPEKP